MESNDYYSLYIVAGGISQCKGMFVLLIHHMAEAAPASLQDKVFTVLQAAKPGFFKPG